MILPAFKKRLHCKREKQFAGKNYFHGEFLSYHIDFFIFVYYNL